MAETTVPTNLREDGDQTPVQSPWRLFWKHFRRSQVAVWGGIILVVFYLAVLFAGFLSPYDYETQYRRHNNHPPTKVKIRDRDGNWHRPFVYATEMVDPMRTKYGEVEDDTRYPIKFFVRGADYKLLWLFPTNIHLLGVDEPGHLFVFGTDALGRDIYSRLLHGGRISLSVGLLGILLTYSLGLLVGGIAGYYGGVVDNILMRFSEVLMSIPGLYLILALRAAFPADIRSDLVYLIIIGILALVYWARLARIIRGMVLSLRENEYVTAAEALGVPSMMIIVRHILPNTMSFVIVAATISIPAYILGEVALSFLGAGIQEPIPSWGNMLQQAQKVSVLKQFPWILTPGVFIFLAVLAFNFLGDGLRDALDPKKVQGDS
ncbi:MAG: ABC transporter permease [Candidatus Eisenbacteria bacterium]|uniref:ABC transporter permease n=1 Tax=Eiseniibacteriota bacterium TaxID=2212470 RepID=A0A7Y2E811_UNCEI|nr:ABC transporter permease [Candidatus Eisenbacteria bacterium]